MTYKSSYSLIMRLGPFLKERKLVFLVIILLPVVSFLQLAQPILLKYAIDEGIVAKNPDKIWYYVLIALVVTVMEYGSRLLQTVAAAKATQKLIVKLREALVQHLLKLNARFYDKNMSGALLSNCTADFDALSDSLRQGVLQSAVDSLLILGSIVGMFLLSPWLGLWASLLLPIIAFIIIFFSRKIKKSTTQARKRLAWLSAFTQENLWGIATVKILAAEQDALTSYKQHCASFKKAQVKAVSYDALLYALLDGLSAVTIGLAFWLIVSHWQPNQGLSVGTMIAFVRYIQQFFEPVKQLGTNMSLLQTVFSSLERIFKLLDRKDIISGTNQATWEPPLTLNKVSFKYQEETVLKDINLNIHRGESIGILGVTGSGKSTLIKLISKTYDDYSGHIKLHGQDLQLFDRQSISRCLALVPQDVVIFSGSIMFNLSLGLPWITPTAVNDAVNKLGLQAFIEAFPNTYEYQLNEGGKNLSQGQRQMLAYIRALCRRPKILILDEATASIDPESEALLQQATKTLLQEEITIIVIAHRLSTVKSCDRLVVLKKGEIVAEGKPYDLLDAQGNYHY